MMGDKELEKVAMILNNTDFKVLMWSMNQTKTWKAGLKNCQLLNKLSLSTNGKQKLNIYIYAKVDYEID